MTFDSLALQMALQMANNETDKFEKKKNNSLTSPHQISEYLD